jgi:hypothetical protein
MRAIQLVDYYTKKPAPEVDRVRIQARIDELEIEFAAEKNETERTNLRWRIGCLKGNHRMPRG